MAERFSECDEKELEQLKENAGSAQTEKSTKTWITVCSNWTENKGFNLDFISCRT